VFKKISVTAKFSAVKKDVNAVFGIYSGIAILYNNSLMAAKVELFF
jgi:hypothetical protein